MLRTTLAAGAAALALVAAAAASAQELRLGFINTLSGPGANIGQHQVNGWKLGLEHEGWTKDGDKLGGVAAKVVYADDQNKVDVGVKEVEKLLTSDRIHILAGHIWSNILMATAKPVFDAKVGLVVTNAGASPMAGEGCNPLFVSTSWNNDQTPESMGKYMSDQKIETIYMLAPNYQAGKDMVSGVNRTLKGPKVMGESFFKLGESDFQAELTKIRAEKPKAVFVFAPGGMGIAFMKQWGASGLGREIKLYTVFVVDWLTLNPIGDAAVGTFHTNFWNVDLKFPANEKFVKDYAAKFGHMPSHFAAQSYDAPRLIAAALKKTGGKFDDMAAFVKTMRRTPFDSVRGPFEYNVNGIPIQNFYLREAVKGADGKLAIVTRGVVFEKHKDSYWEKCPADKRA
jgi:branched-chain amino acid transport system substrate-binding protein